MTNAGVEDAGVGLGVVDDEGVPLLFTFDVAGTVADIDGLSHVDLLCGVSGRSRAEVRRVLRDTVQLKTLPARAALTRELVEQACAALGIGPDQFPFGSIPLAPYRLRPEAPMAVAAAASRLTTALITNSSVFGDPGLRPVSDGLAPHLAGVHASWAMGAAKPDPRAFRSAAAYHRVRVPNLIHIGDSWTEDVAPVLALGGRAVWLNHHGGPIPGSEPVPPGRLIVATSLTEGVEHAIFRWLEPRRHRRR